MADPTPRPLPPSALARVVARLWQRRLEREARMREADARYDLTELLRRQQEALRWTPMRRTT